MSEPAAELKLTVVISPDGHAHGSIEQEGNGIALLYALSAALGTVHSALEDLLGGEHYMTAVKGKGWHEHED